MNVKALCLIGALCISVTARADDTSNNFNMNQSENNNNLSLTTNIQQQTINTLEETRGYLIQNNLLSQQQASQLYDSQIYGINMGGRLLVEYLRLALPNFSFSNDAYRYIFRNLLRRYIHAVCFNNNG